MQRREFLQLGTGALMAGVAVSRDGEAHAAQAPGAAAGAATAAKLKVDAYSRHLQWLRTADEVAAATIEMGYDGVNLTVRDYPGHVNPANVAKELPPFVETLRARGLLVRSITTNIVDADSPHAEAILAAASAVGITHHWWGAFRYELAKPIWPQIDALKPRVAKLAALSEKYKMTACYHTYSMPGTVGSAFWDLLWVLKEFDPKHVGFHYDTGHQAHHINGLWEVNLRAAGAYLSALAVKDYMPVQEVGGAGQGGDRPAPTGPAAVAPGGPGGAGGPRGQGRPPGDANGWRTRTVPLGTGLVDLPRLASALKDLNFSGPVEVQAEYPLGGAESARDAITIPRAEVLGAMARDLQTLRRGFAASGLL